MLRQRILFFHTIPFFSGGERFIVDIMTFMKSRGLDVFLMARSRELCARSRARTIPTSEVRITGFKRTINPLRLTVYSVKILILTPYFLRCIRRKKIDCVYVNSWDAFLLICLAARLAHIPLFLHVHEIIHPHRLTRIIFRLIGHLVTHIIAVSNAVAHHLVSALAVPAMKVEQIYNGIDLHAWPLPIFSPAHGGLVIATVGRIASIKGIHVFIESAKEILRQWSNVEFWIVGKAVDKSAQAYQVSLQHMVRHCQLQEKIKFLGWQQDIAEVLSHVDIVVVPSLFPDPFPYAVLEAMAMGKPVVATKVGGIPEAVVDGETGLLVEPENSHQLAQALDVLLAHPELRQEMARASRRRVEQYFTLEQAGSQIISTIQRFRGYHHE